MNDLDLVIVYDETVASSRGREESSLVDEVEDFIDVLCKRFGFAGVKKAGGARPEGGPSIDLLTVGLRRVWPLLEERNPYILGYLADGSAVVDKGLFNYLRKLHQLGVLKPSLSSALEFFETASKRAYQGESAKLLILADNCYNAITGSAIALLLKEGVRAPPQKVYEEFQRIYVKAGKFDNETAHWIKEILEIRKKVERGELLQIRGETLDQWISKAKKFTYMAENILNTNK